MDDSKAAATAFLTSLLSKTLRITTSDTRLFVGEFKCTDADRNIILSRTYEYRLPSRSAAAATTAPKTEAENEEGGEGTPPESQEKVVLDMTSRYLGLVVVPGEFITKMEVEEFASQVKDGQSRYASLGGVGLADSVGHQGVVGTVV